MVCQADAADRLKVSTCKGVPYQADADNWQKTLPTKSCKGERVRQTKFDRLILLANPGNEIFPTKPVTNFHPFSSPLRQSKEI